MLFFGIDWGLDVHTLHICNEQGAVLHQGSVAHSVEGFEQVEKLRRQFDVPASECLVGIETTHNMLVDYLLDHGYVLYIIPPSAVKGYRERRGHSGAYHDGGDAWLLAEAVRGDRPYLRRWEPHTAAIQQLRVQLRLVEVLRRGVQEHTGQLRAALLRTYPSAVDLFSNLSYPVTLHFLAQYPTAEEGRALDLATFQAFCEGHQYRRADWIGKRYEQLQAGAPVASAAVVQAYRPYVQRLAQVVLPQVQARQQALREMQRLFRQHPDHAIFASLPGAGDLLAPALLAKFGEQRERFPRHEDVQALAGTCPVTHESGHHRQVAFRQACDREFRRIVQQWAQSSRQKSSWAEMYWQQVRKHCASDSHATRILGNRWLAIVWTLWQRRQPYDEAYHLQQRKLRSQPRP